MKTKLAIGIFFVSQTLWAGTKLSAVVNISIPAGSSYVRALYSLELLSAKSDIEMECFLKFPSTSFDRQIDSGDQFEIVSHSPFTKNPVSIDSILKSIRETWGKDLTGQFTKIEDLTKFLFENYGVVPREHSTMVIKLLSSRTRTEINLSCNASPNKNYDLATVLRALAIGGELVPSKDF